MTKYIYTFDTPVVSIDANAFSGTGKVLLPKSVKIITNIENSPISFVTPSGKITESKNEIPHNEIWYKASEICNLGESTIPIQESTEDNEFGWKRHIFSEDLTEMPAGVFSKNEYSDSTLEKVLLPNSVTSIGRESFQCCTSLTSITIPESVKSIGDWAFENCSSLTSITIPNSVTSIGYGAFDDCSSLTYINIPNSVTSIGGWAFDGCSSLTYINIPNSVTAIGYGVFLRCSSLTSITIPNSVTIIGDSAFWNCSFLTSMTIPNSVTSIGYKAFSGCGSLTSITIPEGVTSIGSGAFNLCDSLTSITCKATTPPTIGSDNDLPNVQAVYVPAESVDLYKNATNWSYYSGVIKPIE